ncbi:hypothetical protein AMTRI_Chr03g142220 [Amborella trichopoda]
MMFTPLVVCHVQQCILLIMVFPSFFLTIVHGSEHCRA